MLQASGLNYAAETDWAYGDCQPPNKTLICVQCPSRDQAESSLNLNNYRHSD